ncbi:hypothetical protein [Pleionea sediminis]|uniref:hypothetical protein n=1 Tax=Pleionea sediminis TaxID=2569479 RepID=UPI001185FB24|nr:hypothetical protein [Pleionea sediminis]
MDLFAFILTFFLNSSNPDSVHNCVDQTAESECKPTLVGGNGGTTPPDNPEGDKGEGEEEDTLSY